MSPYPTVLAVTIAHQTTYPPWMVWGSAGGTAAETPPPESADDWRVPPRREGAEISTSRLAAIRGARQLCSASKIKSCYTNRRVSQGALSTLRHDAGTDV